MIPSTTLANLLEEVILNNVEGSICVNLLVSNVSNALPILIYFATTLEVHPNRFRCWRHSFLPKFCLSSHNFLLNSIIDSTVESIVLIDAYDTVADVNALMVDYQFDFYLSMQAS